MGINQGSSDALPSVAEEFSRLISNSAVNGVITFTAMICCAYVGVVALLQRNIIHPLESDDQECEYLGTSLVSLFFILITALAAGWLVKRIKLPPLFGALIIGVAIRNISYFNLLLTVSPRWEYCTRVLALASILVRWGLGIDSQVLKNNPVLPLSLGVFSALAEAAVIAFAAGFIFGFSPAISIIAGFLLAASSPAVVVPVMLWNKEEGRGEEKGVPSTILATASVDNLLCIAGLTTTIAVVFSKDTVSVTVAWTIGQIIIGIFVGILIGYLLWWFPQSNSRHTQMTRSAFLSVLTAAAVLGTWGLGFPSGGIIAALLFVFIAASKWKIDNSDGTYEQERTFSNLWNFIFMPLLFALIGMKVDFDMLTWYQIGIGCALVGLGLLGRFVSAFILSFCSDFTIRENILLTFSLLPKATIQAAFGPGLLLYSATHPEYTDELQQLVITCIVSIVLTAPLGQLLLIGCSPILLNRRRNNMFTTSFDDPSITTFNDIKDAFKNPFPSELRSSYRGTNAPVPPVTKGLFQNNNIFKSDNKVHDIGQQAPSTEYTSKTTTTYAAFRNAEVVPAPSPSQAKPITNLPQQPVKSVIPSFVSSALRNVPPPLPAQPPPETIDIPQPAARSIDNSKVIEPYRPIDNTRHQITHGYVHSAIVNGEDGKSTLRL